MTDTTLEMVFESEHRDTYNSRILVDVSGVTGLSFIVKYDAAKTNQFNNNINNIYMAKKVYRIKSTKPTTKVAKPLPKKCTLCKSYNSNKILDSNNGMCVICYAGEREAYAEIWIRRIKELT